MRILSGSVLVFGVWLAATAYGCGGKSEENDADSGRGGTSGAAGSGGRAAAGMGGKASAGSGGKGAGGSAGASAGAAAGTAGAAAGTDGGGSDASGGSGAMAGTPSEAGAGGDAGAEGGGAGTGGAAGGSAGSTSGAAGSAGSSGSAGAGGGSSSGPECDSADDCSLQSDCCTCASAPNGAPLPSCQSVCVDALCQVLGIASADVTCSFGRCVLARSCDASQVTCPAKPVQCPAGQVNSVEGDCWGPCLPPTECQDVSQCSDCPEGTVCMTFESQLPSIHCIEPADGCEAGNYCECLGACPFDEFCSEDRTTLTCPCPVC